MVMVGIKYHLLINKFFQYDLFTLPVVEWVPKIWYLELAKNGLEILI